MGDGFLGRWSRRKLDARQGKAAGAQPAAPAEPVVAANARTPEPAGDFAPRPRDTTVPGPGLQREGGNAAAVAQPAPAEPAPTLEDVQSLTAQSDFRRFAAADVAPQVKNAAMKKLFADPRYNVMDGLDVYTGDYSQPDPIPAKMLRQLAGAKFLGLFDDEETEEAGPPTRDVADNPGAQSVAQSAAAPDAVAAPNPHADPDLRLQQDDAPPGEEPGRRTP